MKSEARNRLRNIVGKARKLVEEDIKSQLLRLGIKDNELIPVDRLEHLDDSLIENRRRIEEAIHKEKLGNLSEKEGFERYIRHVGFTFINRVAAFKAMEVRNLLSRETVTRREKYAGYSAREYEVSEREGINDPEKIAEIAFRKACEEISEEISVLFDLSDEYSILFPSTRVLAQIYEYFGKDIPDEDWQSDDVIGWIYQYYNSEARKEFRKNKRKPKPDDIPIINQFYTSDWIVKALVDNTLGRLWLESRGEMYRVGEGLSKIKNASVKGFCDYIVPEDAESRRDKIDPHEIKILDPACGSGHFLVYAFDVLFLIYREYDPSLSGEQICECIIENNLYGIDIDLRAVQLAALALYLKAKKLSSKTTIKAMNLVCADARIIDGEMQKKFVKSLEPNLDLQRAFVKLFDELAFTYNIGSLFRVRERFEKATSVYQESLSQYVHDFNESDTEKGNIQHVATIEDMLSVLKQFEQEAIESHDMGTLLFTAEAQKSTGLLTLLTQKYDVVVMNPPYGYIPKEAKTYLRSNYPRTHYDYYTMFMEQAVNLCEEDGFIGMLTGRTFMFLKRLERIRTEILYCDARPILLFDLNAVPSDAILDEATARWAATVVRVGSPHPLENKIRFLKLTELYGEDAKKLGLADSISCLLEGKNHVIEYSRSIEELRELPGMPYSYYAPKEVIDLFTKFPPLDRDNAGIPTARKIANLKQGLVTGDDKRFVRYWWEVEPSNIALNREDTHNGCRWVYLAKGGSAYYSNLDLVVNWENDGQDIKEFSKQTGKPTLRNLKHYFINSLSWSNIASSFNLDFRIRTKESIFGHAAHSLFLENGDYFSLMGLLNSSVVAYLYSTIDPLMHNRSAGYIARLPIPIDAIEGSKLGERARRVFEILEEMNSTIPTSVNFYLPIMLKIIKTNNTNNSSFDNLLESCLDWHQNRLNELRILMKKIDMEAANLYEISTDLRSFIRSEVNKISSNPLKELLQLSETSVDNLLTHVLHYYACKSLEEDSDGILTLSKLVDDVRTLIKLDFGNLQNDFEKAVKKNLDRSIHQWIAIDFFPFHTSVYKRRPIIWQMSSENFSSAKKRRTAFDCFIHYHAIDKDTLHKIRSKYLKAEIDASRWTAERLRKRMIETEAVDSGVAEQLAEAEEVLDELEKFDAALKALSEPSKKQSTKQKSADWITEKVAEITMNGWSPVIDYGIRVNIKPLQDVGILHKAARRIK